MMHTNNSSSLSLVVLFALAILAAGCNLPGAAPAADEASAQIIAPADGAQLAADEMVTVETRVSYPSGAQQAFLLVNDIIVRNDALTSPLRSGRMLQSWQPPGPGTYILQVNFNADGGTLLSSNKITVVVGGESQPPAQTEEPFTPISPTVEVEPETAVTITPTWTETITLTPSTTITITPSATASVTPTATLGAPFFAADQGANCRGGPSSSSYTVRTGIGKGDTVPITGKSSPEWGLWWVVQVNGVSCWVYSELGTAGGDLNSVPVVPAPPTPTPTFTATPAPPPPPTLLSPSGTLNCADATGGVMLAWTTVNYPGGINYYEWALEGPFDESGSTSETQAKTGTLTCAGAVFRWRVRTVGGNGSIGPWSDYMTFTLP